MGGLCLDSLCALSHVNCSTIIARPEPLIGSSSWETFPLLASHLPVDAFISKSQLVHA
jgi:hypothetical protein